MKEILTGLLVGLLVIAGFALFLFHGTLAQEPLTKTCVFLTTTESENARCRLPTEGIVETEMPGPDGSQISLSIDYNVDEVYVVITPADDDFPPPATED